jgi:AraC-like DNA-binding protein
VKHQANWGIHVEWLADYLLRNGITLDEISATVGHQIDDATRVYLPIDDYLNLFGWSAKRLSAPHLGLDIADEVQAESFGILGYLLKNAPTVAAYCEMLERYQFVLMTGMQFSFRTTGRHFEVHWQIFRPPSEGVRHDIEFSLAAFVKLLRDALGDSIVPRNVAFSHACEEPRYRYAKMFGSDVLFNQDQDCLFFSANLLGMPLSDSDPRLLTILKEHADTQPEQWEVNENLIEQAKFIITTSLETQDAGAETLARMLHITTRTLNRHLRQRGTNYKKLREEVILELAKQSLADTDANITVIGGKLGYSESSAFVRAFKRMTGTTPAAYRKSVQEERPVSIRNRMTPSGRKAGLR